MVVCILGWFRWGCECEGGDEHQWEKGGLMNIQSFQGDTGKHGR